MRKRILSILLCLVMVVALFPTMAFAAEDTPPTEPAAAETILDEQDAEETPAPAAEEEPEAPEVPAAQQPAPTGEAAPEQTPDQQPEAQPQQPETEGSKGTEATPTPEEQPVPPENNVEDQGEAQPEQQPAEGAGPADANSEETEEQPGDSVVTYTITFTDELGTASDETGSEITQAAEGTLVTITAKDRAEEGLLFTAWQAPDGLELADDTEEITTFTMPDSNVELAAEYAPLPEDAEALAEKEEIMLADASGATTGSGTKSNPYCVSTYAEMKRLLQTQASYYIKVVGMDNDATNDGVPVRRLVAGRDFESTEPAIDIPSGANHHLEIATKIWFITDPTDGDKNIFGRLIDVERGSSLEVTGTGSLRVEVNTFVATNAIICNWGGELTIDGSVVLSGIQDFTSNVATRPIYINGGITNIKGGYIYGHNNMKATSDGVTSAIHFGDPLGKGTALNISGGTIRQYNNEINQENENSCALYVDNDTVANAIHLTGGTFEGGMKMKTGKPLSNLLVEGYQFNDMSTNTVFDGSVSKTQKALVVTPAGVDTTIINNVSLTVPKSPNERVTLSDFDCSYSQNDKMVLANFGVYPGLNSTSKEIKDHTTPYDSSADYTVMYVFKKKDGFSFSRDVENHVTVSGGEFWKADQMGGKKGLLRVFVNFPAASAAGQVVKTVTIQVKPQAERTKLEDFDCQSYTPTDSMGNPARFLREGLNTDGSGSTPAAYDKNKDYSVVYQFPINSGCTIAEDISTADVTINDGQVWKISSDSDGKNLLVYVNFPKDSSTDPNYVTEAAVQVAAVAGEIPSINGITVTSSNADKIKKALVLWSNTSTPFVAGQEYSTTVYLEPKEGVTFADDMKLNVNGKIVDLAKKDPNGSVQFLVKITATGSTHTHSYGTDWKYDDTNHWHECECGDKADIAAHSASEWIVDTAATETADGAKHKECTVCKKVLETATIPATHSHSYGTEWKYDDTNHWHECECGDKADVAAHSASEWIVDTAATETADGAKHKECTVCKKVLETATIPATGSTHTHSYGTDWKYDDTNHWHECECGDKADIAAHSASEWIVDTAATETADGAKHKECTVCKKVLETATIPATGSTHTHSYGTDWKYDDTHHWHECTDASCPDKTASRIDKAEHTFVWKIDVPASQASTGTKHEECTVCGKKRNENTVIDKLPGSGSHHSSNNSNNNNTGTEAAAPEAAAPAPAASAPVTTTTSARTGDSSNLIGWLAALFVSGGVLTVLGLNGKKRKESEDE